MIVGKKKGKFEKEIHKIMGKLLEESNIQIVPHLLTEKEFAENEAFKKEVEKGKLAYERATEAKK